ncbi:MAG: NAD/FAD-dependent oxidoreductase, partial [Bacteroidetes bacterium QS_1_63_11]
MYVAGNAIPDAEVAVFEKSRGVCVRAAARRRNGIVYGYGANYLTDDDGRVSDLVTDEFDEGLVELIGSGLNS